MRTQVSVDVGLRGPTGRLQMWCLLHSPGETLSWGQRLILTRPSSTLLHADHLGAAIKLATLEKSVIDSGLMRIGEELLWVEGDELLLWASATVTLQPVRVSHKNLSRQTLFHATAIVTMCISRRRDTLVAILRCICRSGCSIMVFVAQNETVALECLRRGADELPV